MLTFKEYKTEQNLEEANVSSIFVLDLATGKASVTKSIAKALTAVNRTHTFAINAEEGIQYMKNGNDKKIGKYPFYIMNMFSEKAKGVRSRADVDEAMTFSDGETYAIDVRRRKLIKPAK